MSESEYIQLVVNAHDDETAGVVDLELPGLQAARSCNRLPSLAEGSHFELAVAILPVLHTEGTTARPDTKLRGSINVSWVPRSRPSALTEAQAAFGKILLQGPLPSLGPATPYSTLAWKLLEAKLLMAAMKDCLAPRPSLQRTGSCRGLCVSSYMASCEQRKHRELNNAKSDKVRRA